MYLYVYDEFVQEKKHQREVASVENRLTDLGLSGKIVRLALFRHAGEHVKEEARRGASTVVVVGNDQTVCQVLDAVAEVGLPLGVIPIGPNNTLAEMLGIPNGVDACDILSARTIEPVDLGLLNGRRFVTGVCVAQDGVRVACEGRYTVSAGPGSTIEVQNLRAIGSGVASEVANPQDGALDVLIHVPKRAGVFRKKVGGMTKLPCRFGKIHADVPIKAYCDGQLVTNTSFTLEVEPKGLRLITGRNRQF